MKKISYFRDSFHAFETFLIHFLGTEIFPLSELQYIVVPTQYTCDLLHSRIYLFKTIFKQTMFKLSRSKVVYNNRDNIIKCPKFSVQNLLMYNATIGEYSSTRELLLKRKSSSILFKHGGSTNQCNYTLHIWEIIFQF